ncbi:hypothetical protein [Trichothermofontia sp.]
MLQDNPVIPLTDDLTAATAADPVSPVVDLGAAPDAPLNEPLDAPLDKYPNEPRVPPSDAASDATRPVLGAAIPGSGAEATEATATVVEATVVMGDRDSPDGLGTRTEETADGSATWSAASQALVVLGEDTASRSHHEVGLVEYAAVDRVLEEEGVDPEPRLWPHWSVLAVIGLVCVVSFGSSLFLFTRPCAIGSCQPLELAERLQQQAIDQANTDTYGLTTADLAKSRQQLLRAIDYLGDVPRWSEAAREANRLVPQYRAQLKTLDLIILAQDKATAAAQRSQNPPHPLAEWTAIRALWQEAIAPLEQVPKTSGLAPLAERKLVEYQVNLNAIAQRIQREQESDRHLTAAKTAADTAESRQPHASTLADWQELATLWDSAVRPLQLIPSGTMAHANATDLLPYYQGKLNTVRDRIRQEEQAETTYRKALQLAEQARASERQNQWSKALTDWQAARARLQEIPPDTLPATQAQSLIPTYDEAMRSAQSNLVAFNNLQNIRNDLEHACGGQPRRCTHSVSAAAITVTLTPDYEVTLNTAERLQSELVRAEIINQWQALDFTLQSISRNAGIPVQVYDSTGSLLTTHSPNG